MNDNQDDSVIEDDYYAFLNIPKNATEEEITNAYRRLSRLYHPDKHVDVERKRQAEILFNKAKNAHSVLSDPHSRAIYDNFGIAGLETKGWEIVQRTKTPQEIREEYEKLAREQEQERLQRRTNPKSSIVLNINATDLFNPYDDENSLFDLRDLFGLPYIDISGISVSQSIEAPLTTKHMAILSGHIDTRNGNGDGNVSCSVRRLLSEKGWGEIEVGAGNGLNVSFKGLRMLTEGCTANGTLVMNLSPNVQRIGTVFVLANQLCDHTTGFLTWKAGMQSSMSSLIIHDTPTRHVETSLNFGIPHSYFSLTYLHKMPEKHGKVEISGRVGTFGAIIEYGARKKISQHSTLKLSMSIGVPTGVTLKIKLWRSSQLYSTSILLCDEIMPAPIIYGTLVPVLTWVAVQKFIVQPYLKEQKRKERQRQREIYKERLAEKRDEANSAIDLMRETVKKIIDQEESKKGLVIEEALYGNLISDSDEMNKNEDMIHVTIPLQCTVKDSKLVLQDSTKSQLPGFYDPCPGEEKVLRVRYLFRAVHHQVTIKDNESLRIPKQSHRIDG